MGRKLSDETKRKISVSRKKWMGENPLTEGQRMGLEIGRKMHLGRHRSDETKKRIGAASARRKHTEETRTKMSLSHKRMTLSEEHRKAIARGNQGKNKGRIRSSEYKKKMSETTSREKHWNWQGGISSEPYPTTWTEDLREAIRKRDGHRCVSCGAGQEGKRLDIHHVDYDKANLDPRNLVSLCRSCHVKTNTLRDYWPGFLRSLVAGRGALQ